jgi:protocatechuate 3,4-dioxygenase beta subunit
MLPTGVITGRIFNEQGEPMQGVSVAALRQLYSVRGRHLHPVQNAISDDKGEYRLFGLKPGTYLVRAGGMQSAFDIGSQTGPYGTNQGNTMIYVPLFFPSAATPEEATPVIVRPGDEAVADFSLARVSAHRVSGRVLGLAPITDAEEHFRYVVAAPEGASTLFTQARAEVKKDSSFQIPALPSGKYRLIVMDADDKGLVRYGTREVSVDSSDLEGVTLDIDGRKQQVNGVVRLEGQTRPDLSHLYVVLGAIGNDSSFDSETNVFASSSGFAQVKRDGSFETEVVPTSNRVCAMVGARGGGFEDWYTSKVLLNGKDVLESGFRIADLQGRRLEVVISPHGGSVTGTALDAHKTPFAGAQIVALPSDPKLRDRYDLVQRTIADQQGRFKLRGVRPGSYIVMALEDEQQQPFTENGFLEKNADKIRTVKVDQSATQLELHTIPVESY